MKNKLAETKFKSALCITGHLFSRVVCLGAVILICSSASAQNLFVSANDANGGYIYKFTSDGVRSTFASGLSYPGALAIDSEGNLFVAVDGGVILKFTPLGVRSTFTTGLVSPIDLAVDSTGNLFVADYGSGNIYRFTWDGMRTTFASGLSWPEGLAFDVAGNLFAGEVGTGNIYKFTPDGARTTFASGFAGAIDLTVDSTGNLFVSGSVGGNGINVWKITPQGVRTLFASRMFAPGSLAFNSRGYLFVVDLGLTEGPSMIYEFNRNGGGRKTFAKGEPPDDPTLEFSYLTFQPLGLL